MSKAELNIIHFNDVYNLDPQKDEPVGGAARFAKYVKSCKNLNPLILFSGDLLNPSLMSIFLKGEQMVPVLNSIGVHAAVYGNHDFDFGVDHLESVTEKTKFPWLLSNVRDNLTTEPLAEGVIMHMIEWAGHKVGLIGLIEEEWIDTLATLDPEDVTFEDFVERGNELAKRLRDNGADIVIALTHMRWPNDRKLAEQVDGIDIVLGGHDHECGIEQVNGKYIIKSGTDFRNLSKVKMTMNNEGIDVNIEVVEITSEMEEDPEVLDIVKQLQGDINEKMDEYLGDMNVELDGRFSAIRTSETNLGNFVTDIMLEVSHADCALLNSGTFRSDRVHPKGCFKLRDLLTILPLVDPLVVVKVSRKDLITALENSVSHYPSLEGRFLQVSGVKFGFDPSKPKYQRVATELVMIQDQYIELEKDYKVCLKEYIANGKDGYEVFKDCEIIVTSEQCCTLSTAVRNHFESVQIIQGVKACKSGHRQSLVSLVRKRMLVRHFISKLRKDSMARKSPADHTVFKLQKQKSVQNVEEEQSHLSPEVEGRIYVLNDQTSPLRSAVVKGLKMIKESYIASKLTKTTIVDNDEEDEELTDVMSL